MLSSAPSSGDIFIISGPVSTQSIKGDKENMSLFSESKHTATTATKKHHLVSDSEPDLPCPHNTKCVCSSNIQAHLKASSSERREFQGKLMIEVKEGNRIVAESVWRTADFQDSLLKVFTALIRSAVPQN